MTYILVKVKDNLAKNKIPTKCMNKCKQDNSILVRKEVKPVNKRRRKRSWLSQNPASETTAKSRIGVVHVAVSYIIKKNYMIYWITCLYEMKIKV